MLQEAIGLERQMQDLITMTPGLERLFIIRKPKILLSNLVITAPGGHLHPEMEFFGLAPAREIFIGLILFGGIFRTTILRVVLFNLFMRNLPVFSGLAQRKDFFVKT
jgi:hypothetical protein